MVTEDSRREISPTANAPTHCEHPSVTEQIGLIAASAVKRMINDQDKLDFANLLAATITLANKLASNSFASYLPSIKRTEMRLLFSDRVNVILGVTFVTCTSSSAIAQRDRATQKLL